MMEEKEGAMSDIGRDISLFLRCPVGNELLHQLAVLCLSCAYREDCLSLEVTFLSPSYNNIGGTLTL